MSSPPSAALRRIEVPTRAGTIVARVGSEPVGGAAILLIHGAAGSWASWLPVLDAAPHPLPGVVAVDLPGWGESPDPVGAFDEDAAAEALEQVLRRVGATRWTIAGHSLGGIVALALAARTPEATTGVLLVSPTGPAVLDAIRRPIRGGVRLPWFAGMLLVMRSLAALPGGGRGVLRLLGRLHAFGPLAAPLFTGPVPAEVAAAFATEIRPAAFRRAAAAARTADLDSWSRIERPVRAVRGRRDVFAGVGDAAAFRRLLPDFAEAVLPDAGHFALVERPDAVLALLRTLLPEA